MKKTILTFALLLSFLITDTAFACKPGPTIPTTQNEMAATKDAVFIGTVQSIYQDKNANADYKVLFKVNQAYKGLNGSNTVTVDIASSSAACGYDNGYESFKPGTVWIINANGSVAEGFTTNSLSLNSSYNSYGVAQLAMIKLQAQPAPVKATDPVMCTMEYRPVCGKKDTGIRCITTPCPSSETKTYGNSCMLSADKAEYLYEGECKGESTTTVTPKPTVNIDASADVDASGDTELPVDVAPLPKVTFWQKIMLSIKGLFSFWK